MIILRVLVMFCSSMFVLSHCAMEGSESTGKSANNAFLKPKNPPTVTPLTGGGT